MGRGKSRASLELIEASRQILEEIEPASVRAVCYRLFTLGIIPNMKKSNTDKVSKQLTWAREQGIVPWGSIVDETRRAERVNAWANPAAFVETVRRSYRRNRWNDQLRRVEIWSEKGTIRGTLADVLHETGVTLRVMHGYSSSTAIWQAATESLGDKPLIVFYVGDWDPSGLHMSQVDLPTRIAEYGGEITFKRIALDEGDCTSDLPSFEASTKRGDPRFKWFQRHYGSTCWELDALSPPVLRERVKGAIVSQLDLGAWTRAGLAEMAETESLTTILSTWPGISGQASKYDEGRTR